jgi:DNA-binding IclR family transcriptional regulator
VDKGSASRLISTLAKHGYSEKDPVTPLFSLEPNIIRLSDRLLSHMPIQEAAKPSLH